MVHLANASAVPLAFTETLWVVFETSPDAPSDLPVYQIQLWHVVVLHPMVDPDSNRVPPKQT